MVLSMTGFSSKTITIEQESKKGIKSQIHMTMTLKSLNSRFFELNCKLPFALTQLETELIKYLKDRLHRGNIYFTIHMSNPDALSASIEPSLNIVEGYLNAIKKIQTTFTIPGSIEVTNLIDLPNIFETCDEPIDQNTIKMIFNTINDLVKSLNDSRLKEGQNLAIDISNRTNKIMDCLNKLEPRAKVVQEQKKNSLIKNLSCLLNTESKDEISDAQSTMIYNQLEKIDIHEEIVRFKTHIESLKNQLESKETEKGKKIDFTLQELFREINTITSKCSDGQISSIAIDIKVELEKAREQAQNIL